MNGGLIAIGLGLIGWGAYRATQSLSSLDYRVNGIRVHQFNGLNLTLAVNLQFINPGHMAIDVDGLFLKIMQKGDTLATATSNHALSVKPMATTNHDVMVNVPLGSLVKAKLENGAYNLTLNGTITPKGLGTVYIDKPVSLAVNSTLAALLSKISGMETVSGIDGPATRLLRKWNREVTPEQRAKWDAKRAERKARRAQRLAANPFKKRRPHAMAAG